ncbi:PAS domain-containing sensor histidine kinase [Flavihumibacter solisilvae]|uniref:PAS domain-containing sensor histidine kinase n=1 Tax=Flavihumibacter solisilvae TaxID=1349421 RepID=UPI00068FBB82|nr:PAS domain S-box protein [Flavihumibacter solisilvae]
MTTISLIPPGLPKRYFRLRLLAAVIVLAAAISILNSFQLFDSGLVKRFSENRLHFSILLVLTGLLLILQPLKTKISQLVPYYIGGMLVSIPAFAPGDATSFYFLVCGVAILLMESHTRLLHYAAQVLLIFAATVAYLVVLTFIYDLSGPRTTNSLVFMAPSTAIALLSLSLGILLQNPDKGGMKNLSGSYAGSVTFRILWPAAVLIPTILGTVRLLGHRYGYYTNESGIALFAVGTILVFLGFLYYTSLDLNRRDELRIKMEQSLQRREDELQAVFANAPDAVIVMDSNGLVVKWNPAAEKIFGWTATEVTGKLLIETIIPPDYRSAHQAGLERYLQTGESRISYRTIEMPALRKDGELTEISMRITPYTLHGRPYFVGFLRDVSEIKKTERKRLFAEQKFTGLFESAPDATFITNQQGLILSANQQSTELFGLSARQLTGRKVGTLVEADFTNLYNERRSSPEYDGRDFRIVFESKAIVPGNRAIPVEISLSAFYSDEGVLFSSAIRDITHRKANEAKLNAFNRELSRQIKEKTRELDDVLERLTDAFIGLDHEYRYTYLNRKAGELIQKEPVDLIGKKVWEVFPEAMGTGTYNAMVSAMASQQYTTNIDYIEPLDLWQENHIYPSPEGLSMFIRNITATKRTERALEQSINRYHTFVEEGVDAIMVFSPKEGRYSDVNRKASALLGYSREELLQMHPQQLLFDNDGEPLRTIGLAMGESVTAERMLRRKDGKGIEVETSATKLSDGSILAFVRDITERKHAERELLRLTDELRTLTGHLQNIREEERIHIAREIHDELGQLMTVMKMDIGWLKKHLQYQESDKIGLKLEDILSTVDITIKTIRKIASELRPSLLDDIGLVAAIEWHLTEFSNRTGINTGITLDEPGPELPDQVKTSLFRIVQEALTNVARHSQASKVDVSLARDNGNLVLTVRDNGTGFDANRESRTLGILGMKERALMIGAAYSVESKKGEGTIVTISYPVDNQRE